MSVSWLVFPIVPEVAGWLRDRYALTVPQIESRWPTLDELLEVLSGSGEPVVRKGIFHSAGNTVSS